MKKTNFKLKTKVLNRAVSITALLLVAGVLFTGCPQKVKEEPKPVYYTVTLVSEGGSLTADPAIQDGKALKDSEITFTASPANPSTHMVDKWEITGGQIVSGGREGSTSVKVQITADTTVKVTFKPKPVYYTVTLISDGGSLTANPKLQGGKALKDSELTFTASPANSSTHEVNKWEVTGGQIVSGGGEGSTNVKVQITANTTVKVTFKKKMPLFTFFNIPKAGISKVNTTLIAMVRGANFTSVIPSNFTVNCADNPSITNGSTVTILSDTELTVSLTIPGEAKNYTVTITSGDQSLNGIFSVKDYSAHTIGEIVLKDGSFVTKEAYAVIDPANPPVAVIAGLNGYGRAISIGLHLSYLVWAKKGSIGSSKEFTGIICRPSNTGNGAASTATFTGDLDGSDNWDYICSQDPDGTEDSVVAENYPAFNWVNTYNTTYLTGADIKWYMPSLAELCEVYKNSQEINASIAKIKSLPNGINYADSSLGSSFFWSSSQDSKYSFSAWRVSFDYGSVSGQNLRYDINRVCCLTGF